MLWIQKNTQCLFHLYHIWPWSTSLKIRAYSCLWSKSVSYCFPHSVHFITSINQITKPFGSYVDWHIFWFCFELNSIALSWSCWVHWCFRHQLSFVFHHLNMIHWKFKSSRHIRCSFVGCFGVRSLHICQPKRHVESLLCWHVHLVLVWTFFLKYCFYFVVSEWVRSYISLCTYVQWLQ